MGADASRSSEPPPPKICCSWKNTSIERQWDDVYVAEMGKEDDLVSPRTQLDVNAVTPSKTDQSIRVSKVDFERPDMPKPDPGAVFCEANSMESELSCDRKGSYPEWADLQHPGESQLLHKANTMINEEVDHALRVCVLGGKFRPKTDDEARLSPVLLSICEAFERRPDLNVQLVTGGLEGVQRTFSQHVGENFKSRLVHLKSMDMNNTIETGTYVSVCEKKEDKAEIMANIGSVYILVSGGPGVADEARKALDRGAIVLPFIFTGGASAFQYPSFPEMKRPSYITKKQWQALQTGPGEEAATAVVQIVEGVVTKKKRKKLSNALHAALRLSRGPKKKG